MTLAEIYSSALRLHYDEDSNLVMFRYCNDVLEPLRKMWLREQERQLDEIRRLGT